MQKEEIISGIKQAIERGSSFERAKQSFLNSGYPPQDVEDSARVFLGVSSSIPHQYQTPIPSPQMQNKFTSSQIPIPEPSTNKQQTNFSIPSQSIDYEQKPKSKFMLFFIILLALVLILLLIVLIALMFFPTQFKQLFSSILPLILPVS